MIFYVKKKQGDRCNIYHGRILKHNDRKLRRVIQYNLQATDFLQKRPVETRYHIIQKNYNFENYLLEPLYYYLALDYKMVDGGHLLWL